MMGFYKLIDYHKFAPEVDVISWDSYPRYTATPADVAFSHSLMRAKEGQPWLLLEQTPSQQNWAPYNSLKRPGVMRLWSYQAIAHGSDAVMYFQWRGRFAAGGPRNSMARSSSTRDEQKLRVFQEVAQLGKELESLGTKTLGGRVSADAALLFDWENWWAIEYSIGPSVDLKYQPQAATFCCAAREQHHDRCSLAVSGFFALQTDRRADALHGESGDRGETFSLGPRRRNTGHLVLLRDRR